MTTRRRPIGSRKGFELRSGVSLSIHSWDVLATFQARELSITATPYFVVYRIERRRIEVLTIVHARRRWPP